MKQLYDLVQRIRSINWRELTPVQMAMLGVGALVTVWVLIQVLNLALTLAPVVIGLVALYFGYQWLRNRAEGLPDDLDMTESQADRNVKAAVDTVEAVRRGDAIKTEVDSVQVVTKVVDEKGEEFDLKIKQVINPETGFAEPDISRLEANESAVSTAEQDADAIRRQLEERRQRLLGEDN